MKGLYFYYHKSVTFFLADCWEINNAYNFMRENEREDDFKMKSATIKRKKVISLFLAVMLVTGICSVPVQAKTEKKSATMYVGEKLDIYPIVGTIKKVKSGTSKIASAKKNGSSVIVTAKKPGKTTITIKGSYGNCIYKITVKKLQFDLSVSQTGSDCAVVTVKNKGTAYYDSVDVVCTLRDASGNPVSEESVTLYAVASKSTANTDVHTYDEYVDMSKTTVAISSYRRNTYKCKDYTSKVKYTYNVVENSYGGKELRVTTSTNYKGDGTIRAAYDVFFYDAADNILSVYNNYNALYSTERVETSEISFPADAVRYEVKERAYMYTY